MNLKLQSILAAVVALSLALPGAAMADRRGDDGHHRDYRGGHSYKHPKSHKSHKSHYGNRHHYRGYRGKYAPRNYYYNDDDNGEDLLIGLVVGGILGYALNSSQHDGGYPQTSTPPPASGSYQYSGNSCLQEREYQTTVIVGGKEVNAYGTACLQPDGSWSRSPARVANY
jgi:hypothetical protein